MVKKLKLIRAGDINPEDVHVKGFIYGPPGTGKTWCVSTAPNPLILLTEQNGMTSIRASNPDALVVYCGTIDVVREYLSAAIRGELAEHNIRTIVIDSLTEVQRLFKDEMIRNKPDGALFTIKEWGDLTEKMRQFMRTLRDIKFHVLCTALSESERDETTGARHTWPCFQGKKVPAEVAQYFNFVAFMVKKEDTDENGERVIRYKALLDGNNNIMTKPSYPLTGVLDSNIPQWFDTIIDNMKKGSAA